MIPAPVAPSLSDTHPCASLMVHVCISGLSCSPAREVASGLDTEACSCSLLLDVTDIADG